MKISDHDFSSAIISSVPGAYKAIIAAYENAIRLQNLQLTAGQTKKAVEPEVLIGLLREEAQSRASGQQSKPKNLK